MARIYKVSTNSHISYLRRVGWNLQHVGIGEENVKLRGLKSFFYTLFNLKFPCGYTLYQVKKDLIDNSHSGQYWNVKPKFDPYTGKVIQYMEGNEYYSIDLWTGELKFSDHDY